MVTLRSDGLELRKLDGGDAAFVESFYASAQVTRTLLRIQGPISIEEAREFCQAPATACGDHRFGAALRSDGRLIALGSVRSQSDLLGVATIGYSVVPALWGQGLGTELASLLVEFAAGTLGAPEVRATTLDDHPASARVLQKLGFSAWRSAHPRSTRAVTSAASRDGAFPSGVGSDPGAAEQQAGAGRLDAGRSA